MTPIERRLKKVEQHVGPAPGPTMTPEERRARIDELLAKQGTSLDAEIAKHGSLSALVRATRAQRA